MWKYGILLFFGTCSQLIGVLLFKDYLFFLKSINGGVGGKFTDIDPVYTYIIVIEFLVAGVLVTLDVCHRFMKKKAT